MRLFAIILATISLLGFANAGSRSKNVYNDAPRELLVERKGVKMRPEASVDVVDAPETTTIPSKIENRRKPNIVSVHYHPAVLVEKSYDNGNNEIAIYVDKAKRLMANWTRKSNRLPKHMSALVRLMTHSILNKETEFFTQIYLYDVRYVRCDGETKDYGDARLYMDHLLFKSNSHYDAVYVKTFDKIKNTVTIRFQNKDLTFEFENDDVFRRIKILSIGCAKTSF